MMIQARSRIRGFAACAMAAVLLLATVPTVSADEPVDYVADFQVVSAAVDMETGWSVVTYTFRCLEQVDYIRIRTILAQRHAGIEHYGWSWMTSGVSNCQAGTMVTLPIMYGWQQGSYLPGHAELATSLYAYESTLTVDTETIDATVRLHPAHPAHPAR